MCGRQELALRGHRGETNKTLSMNDGLCILLHTLWFYYNFIICISNCVDDSSNIGNCLSILKYRAKGDEFLRSILENEKQHIKYLSHGIQNQIIEICNNIILKQIVSKVNESKCFSILADETTDISTSEQLTLCVRYIDENGNLNEDFLKFIEVENLTGSHLSSAILNGNK